MKFSSIQTETCGVYWKRNNNKNRIKRNVNKSTQTVTNASFLSLTFLLLKSIWMVNWETVAWVIVFFTDNIKSVIVSTLSNKVETIFSRNSPFILTLIPFSFTRGPFRRKKNSILFELAIFIIIEFFDVLQPREKRKKNCQVCVISGRRVAYKIFFNPRHWLASRLFFITPKNKNWIFLHQQKS